MTTILLARHGETEWNAERRWQGQADPPLSGRGRDQARDLGDRLQGEEFDAAYTSDLRRARETAEIVAPALGIPLHVLSALREIDVGSWSGLTTAEIQRSDPDALARMRAHGYGWEGGETPGELTERVVAALRNIAADHPAGHLLVIAHGGVVRALGAAATGLDYAEYRRRVPVVANCDVSRLAVENGKLVPLD